MTTHATHTHTTDLGHSPLRIAATAVGAVFLVAGVAGFIPGLTSNLDTIEFAGHESGAELFGLFQVSVLHNLVHILFGVLGLLAARRTQMARTYLVAGGIVYLLLWLYGLVIDEVSDANFVPLNDADDWLHLVLGVVMVALGLLLSREVVDISRQGRTARG